MPQETLIAGTKDCRAIMIACCVLRAMQQQHLRSSAWSAVEVWPAVHICTDKAARQSCMSPGTVVACRIRILLVSLGNTHLCGPTCVCASFLAVLSGNISWVGGTRGDRSGVWLPACQHDTASVACACVPTHRQNEARHESVFGSSTPRFGAERIGGCVAYCIYKY
jgi:hypothetical protein